MTSRDDQPYRDRRMSLAGHLMELRRRLMIAAIGLVVGMVIAFIVTDPVIDFLLRPIELVAGELGDDFTRLTYTGPTSAFDMRLRISFAIGIVLSAPVWLWQIWAYVMPGLTRREVRYTVGFMAAAIPLFFGGCVVAVMLLPNVLLVMASFVPDAQFASQFYESSGYYDFVFKMITIVGIAFVLPVFLVALNLAGVVDGRAVLKGWRPAFVIALVFGMLASPPADMVTMLILAVILFALYMAAAVVCLAFDRRKRKRDPELAP
ncbi:twin-arginine translocase subunit TatC [Microbacterium album]|uniref:twin-arginine translocase subunit TatC n=1 Tax=Microbacterium album TaxID=2053191 RepID=UPI0027E5AC73|nr:twin-arginine translocase subunit TatC [Microbacterium album]